MRGGVYGGGGNGLGFLYGEQGAQLTGSKTPPAPDRPARGMGYGETVGARFDNRAWGGTYGFGPKSVGDILAESDGWALVLEREDGERFVASPTGDPKHDIISLSLTFEVNNLSDWRVQLPPTPELYEYSYADAVLGFDGDRLFHGQVLPVSGSSGGAVEIGGFGPLWHATHGHIEESYSAMPVWQAVNDVWQTIAELTDGELRGYALRPSGSREVWLSEENREFSGTPLEVLKELHGIGGLAFSIDHSDPASVAISFAPGEARRTANWRTTDHSVDLDPTGYHNQVTVVGGPASESYPHPRWRSTATASAAEIEAITNGEIIGAWLDKPDLASLSAVQQRAETELDELRGEYSITGSLDITPARAQPGFVYRIEEFETAAPDPFIPVELPLQTVEHSFALGEAQTTLNFETAEGVVGAIRDQIQPGSFDDSISWQDLGFATGGSIHVWGESVWGAGVWGGGDS